MNQPKPDSPEAPAPWPEADRLLVEGLRVYMDNEYPGQRPLESDYPSWELRAILDWLGEHHPGQLGFLQDIESEALDFDPDMTPSERRRAEYLIEHIKEARRRWDLGGLDLLSQDDLEAYFAKFRSRPADS